MGSTRENGERLALLRRFLPRKNSRSGIPGITRIEGGPGRGACWLAYWNDRTGRKVQKRFSVRLHGEDGARKLAAKARFKATERQSKRLMRLLGA
jgi:hypothetical protein